ncbi:DUF1080 domain-containing protein [Telmatocola sphagniphila]|uniref:DUF1080 domain-containing protein n=1 Tax=Telmatocola sphagniphila TaxID=1123043 RepID=A0A8E6EV52_9BACT|nr:DUF1080 domain-containing protein [Telmatocola sphagniphila]QVL32152.1 DUF1080 domain-containing protein [Telmatocola sphagniphila]
MRVTSFLLFLSLFSLSSSTSRADDEKAGPKDNIPPEGFIALFNGKDLTGWQGHTDLKERATLGAKRLKEVQDMRNGLMAETWTVKEGVINHKPKIDKTGKKIGCSLQTVRDYGNFEMYVDWKIEKAGDSGIYVRGTPQIQIWDSDNLDESLKADWGTGSGGLWNNNLKTGVDPKSIGKTPLVKADKPVGEWNTFHIRMVGNKVTVYLNGKLVVDDKALDPYFDRTKPLPATGPIELQYHGDKLWFKNIYLKELK